MVALYSVFYNFGRVHQTLRVTPAMEAGIADHVWSIVKIVRAASMTDNQSAKEREELAWAAGFFDGEGHVGFLPRTCDMQIGMSQNTREVLARFQAAVGLGRVNGPYKPRWVKNSRYTFNVGGHRGVIQVMERLAPWLSAPKLEQYRNVRIKVEEGRAARKAAKSS